MPGKLIQRWTIGAGGFIGEVSLFELSIEDEYVRHGSKAIYVELSDLHVHSMRRGLGWAHLLVSAALQEAQRQGWRVFLRAIPYNKPTLNRDALIAFYRGWGFKSTKLDEREMIWKSTRAK